ncbi:hypothetical protein Tco_0694059 [Tanacetum coccineum]
MLRRKWSDTDKRRSGIMVDLIDKQMLERRILRNLERLVGAREPEMDYRLMQRTRARIDMVIKDLDLEPKIDAMMRGFLDPSWWKELSKETSSKILPCENGSCWKMFKPTASLIAMEKLK